MSGLTHTELKKNVLSTWDVISQSLAFLGPVMSMALALIAVGLVYIAFLRASQPGLVAPIGRDLSALEAPEPVDVRFSHD